MQSTELLIPVLPIPGSFNLPIRIQYLLHPVKFADKKSIAIATPFSSHCHLTSPGALCPSFLPWDGFLLSEATRNVLLRACDAKNKTNTKSTSNKDHDRKVHLRGDRKTKSKHPGKRCQEIRNNSDKVQITIYNAISVHGTFHVATR